MVKQEKQEDEIQQRRPQEILNNFVRHVKADRIKRYFQKGLLVIVDPNTILPTDAGTKQLLDSMTQYIEAYESKLSSSTSIKGKVLLNAPDNFFEVNEFDKFLKFEHLVGLTFDENFAMVCWYRKKWIRNLTFSQVRQLLTAHHSTVHKNAQSQMLNATRILQVISEGIDKAIEQYNASAIILEVMQRRFNLTKSKIVSSPDLFIDVLKKISSDSASAETIINTLTAELKNKLDFDDSSHKNWKSPRITRETRGVMGLQEKKTTKARRRARPNRTEVNRSYEVNENYNYDIESTQGIDDPLSSENNE